MCKKQILGVFFILGILILGICTFLYIQKAKLERNIPTIDNSQENNDEVKEPSADKTDPKEDMEIMPEQPTEVTTPSKPQKPTLPSDPIDNKDNIQKEENDDKPSESDNPNGEGEKEPIKTPEIPETPTIPSVDVEPDPTPEPPIDELTQQEKENDVKRKQLQNTYGLTIVYGNESMLVHGRELVRMTDAETIGKNLDILDKQLQKYPTGFFKSFAQEGMPLTILLVEGVVGKDIAGALDTQDATKPQLILTNRNFGEVIHHELMHCIDLYLRIMMYRDGLDPFTEYEQYNPDDFEYGNIQYVEKETGNPHFWFNYAKTSVDDDRAELFKAMMTVNSVLLKRGALKDKGTVICKQIKKYFHLQEQTYWEKSIGISL